MGNIQLKDKAEGDGKILILEGPFTIEAASQLKSALLEAYGSQSVLELDIRAVESIDLACVQVLCSAHRSFHRAGLGIARIGEIPPGMRSALGAMAIDAESCDSPYAAACPWREGGSDE